MSRTLSLLASLMVLFLAACQSVSVGEPGGGYAISDIRVTKTAFGGSDQLDDLVRAELRQALTQQSRRGRSGRLEVVITQFARKHPIASLVVPNGGRITATATVYGTGNSKLYEATYREMDVLGALPTGTTGILAAAFQDQDKLERKLARQLAKRIIHDLFGE